MPNDVQMRPSRNAPSSAHLANLRVRASKCALPWRRSSSAQSALCLRLQFRLRFRRARCASRASTHTILTVELFCAFAFQAHGLDAASTSVLTQVSRLPSASIGAESSDSASVIVSFATSPSHHRFAHARAPAAAH